MEAIRKKLCFLVIVTVLCLSVAIVCLQADDLIKQFDKNWFLLVTGSVILLLTGLSVGEFRKMKTAGLIIENKILHIQTAQTGVISNGTDTPRQKASNEVFVSGFGVLLDSQTIKFNQNGIYLKAVEIDQDFIYLTYGNDTKTLRTQILHASIGKDELADITEKFRYETGIIPKVEQI